MPSKPPVKIKCTTTLETEVEMTVEQLAKLFCGLSDEQQADFFEEVGKIGQTFGPGNDWHQWFSIGRHMRMCECVSHLGREVINGIHASMMYEPPKGQNDDIAS